SPFYAAGGGQVTDAGYLEKEDGSRATLLEALRLENDQELVFEGSDFGEGDRVRAVVPWSVRYPTMANHTGTHLLHKALQEVLGAKSGARVRLAVIAGWSRELCGGTHVGSTAEVGPCVITTEMSVGAGSRRIEAVTAGEAFAYLRAQAHVAGALRGEQERARK